jgi:peptidyl-dipeptidase A
LKLQPALLALAVVGGLSACGGGNDAPPAPAAAPKKSAEALVAEVNAAMVKQVPELTAAEWLASTYINDESAKVASAANERWLGMLNGYIAEAAKVDLDGASPDAARALHLLKLSSANPAPRDPAKLAEVAQLRTRMEGAYGAGKFCKDPADASTCRNIGELSQVLATSRDYDAQLEAWAGWHSIAPPLRADYQRLAELDSEGAREIGFKDAGELWRAGYDMPPADVVAETDRLWGQVQPL